MNEFLQGFGVAAIVGSLLALAGWVATFFFEFETVLFWSLFGLAAIAVVLGSAGMRREGYDDESPWR